MKQINQKIAPTPFVRRIAARTGLTLERTLMTLQITCFMLNFTYGLTLERMYCRNALGPMQMIRFWGLLFMAYICGLRKTMFSGIAIGIGCALFLDHFYAGKFCPIRSGPENAPMGWSDPPELGGS